MNIFQFIVQNHSEVLELTLEHLWMVAISTLLAVLVGIPLGILITRLPALNKPVLGGANIIQTIPSLALFGFLLPVPWIGARADRLAILALTLYALLPLIRNTYAGIKGVDPSVVEAGRGMGMTDRQLLFQVELPLALSSRQLAGIARGEAGIEPYQLEQFGRASSNAVGGPFLDRRNQADIAFDGEVRKEPGVLDHVSDSAPQTDGVPFGRRPAFYQDFAPGRGYQVVDKFQGCCLARATASEQDERLGSSDLKIQAAQQLRAFTKAVGNVAKLNRRSVLGGNTHRVTVI